jgi:transcriptional regulator with XRE-family HTH domain
MWTHLRAWREFRHLSQERVAEALGKRHTTIGRWERGQMKLSTADLEALASLYGATVHQLQMPPEAADLVARLDRAQAILAGLSKEDLDYWIGMGERLLNR